MRTKFTNLWERLLERMWKTLAASVESRLTQELASIRWDLTDAASVYRDLQSGEATKLSNEMLLSADEISGQANTIDEPEHAADVAFDLDAAYGFRSRRPTPDDVRRDDAESKSLSGITNTKIQPTAEARGGKKGGGR